MSTGLSWLTLGVAPDSWGVWFAEDPHQVGWEQYLDEVAAAGYLVTELGPPGFLPQDPARLRDELAARQLTVCGGTVFAGLHQGTDALAKAKEAFAREARLLGEVGAEFLIQLPEQYTDLHGGGRTESAAIDPGQWHHLVTGTNELARYLLEALAALDRDLFTVVEQDLYPVEPHVPLPIQARTAGYLRGCGLGPVRHWPYLPAGVRRARRYRSTSSPVVVASSGDLSSRQRPVNRGNRMASPASGLISPQAAE